MNSDVVTVLIVEDDPDVASVITRALGAQQFNILSANNLGEALRDMSKADILTMDYMLGRDKSASGVLLERWVAERHGPVIVVSGYVTPELEIELLTNGAYNVLPKPIPMSAYAAIMSRYWQDVMNRRMLGEFTLKLADVELKLARQTKIIVGLAITVFLLAVARGADFVPAIISFLMGLF